MAGKLRLLISSAAAVLAISGVILGQDAPSLGDLARQQRQRKEQSKGAQGKDSKAPKVFTNESLPGHASLAAGSVELETDQKSPQDSSQVSAQETTDAEKQPAEYWKSQIVAQKSQITGIQSQIDGLNESIHFAPANCAVNCAAWNERQKEKQQQVEQLNVQLEDEKKRLDELQESARKQGYGSSVYDP